MNFNPKNADGRVIVLDTETIGLNNRLVYNLGWCVKDADGTIFKRDYLVKEIIELPIYENRYYKKEYFIRKPSKINFYEATEIKTFAEILERFFKDNADGKVACWAYNSPFDSGALLETIEYLNIDLNGDELDCIKNINDILPLTRQWFNKKENKEYLSALRNADGKVSYTVEKVCRVFYKNAFYQERHQALYDSEDEMAILTKITDGYLPIIASMNFFSRYSTYVANYLSYDKPTEIDL